ncbi:MULTISPECIES: Hsp70 family protein [unclassified Microbacterium]|uniref:Hsp70 family protein n=1 Tax=unclassified Microbacterium TaxID=2609290 RepID=UPI000C6ABE58|nr:MULTISPECIES: Hsp70 family protein [unclassified Microbacterium]MBU21344.1 molecular chaperone [Microbacterium sp.]|tara:strand:- start:104 stop:1666 length:1563 start_codon:yes stop_codon:yes gene_type:complete
MSRSIGIDLGTTYSCVIHRSPEHGEVVVESADGKELTPSVVYFASDGSVLVGDRAKDHLADDAENVVVGIKRQMGRQFPLSYHGNEFTPEAISGVILRRLAEDAAAALSVSAAELSAVVTVPAYFGVGEREATFAAASIAGVRCMELLAEPVAAAYAYGLADEPHLTSLVYDLGGGTFDVAVVGMHAGRPRVWAVDGDTQLGGLDWDARIEDLLWEQVEQLEDGSDLRYDDEVMGLIGAASEMLKRRLTTHSAVTERVYLHGRTLELAVSRDDFERVSEDLVLRSLETVDRVRAAASAAGAPPVDQVLLVGGSTRMPMVRRSLETRCELPVKLADPDKAVARGAAVLAEQLADAAVPRLGPAEVRPGAGGVTRITSVLPKSLGVLTHSSGEPLREEPYVHHVLKANTPLPIIGFEHLVATVVDAQDRARIQIYEQAGVRESIEPGDNRLLLEGEILGIPARPAGSPVRLRISVAVDGRITVESADGERPIQLEVEAFLHGVLDDAEVSAQGSVVAGLRLV